MPPEAPRRPTRALSGIQPTGRFHWGNYFGAIRQYIDLQPSAKADATGAHQAADEA
jgi:tryptophanyl-tRNA synthetase